MEKVSTISSGFSCAKISRGTTCFYLPPMLTSRIKIGVCLMFGGESVVIGFDLSRIPELLVSSGVIALGDRETPSSDCLKFEFSMSKAGADISS